MPIDKAVIKSAVIYLEMRGFTVVEHGWRSRNFKIDIIAKKSDQLYFIFIDEYLVSEPSIKLKSEVLKIKRSASDYIKANKISGSYKISSLTIDKSTKNILNFTDNLNY